MRPPRISGVTGVAVALGLAWGTSAAAQPAPGVTTTATPDPAPSSTLADTIAATDRVPDNPAIDLLGAESLKVARPGSIKDLDVELRSLYQNGKLVPQIAIELSPWGLTRGKRSLYKDYLDDPSTRWLRRFTLSLATTSVGDGDASTTLAALGFRVRLIDDADWRLNDELVDCALGAIALPPPTAPSDGPPVDPVDLPADIKQKVERCFASHATPWNAAQLAVGAAISSAFPHGKLPALDATTAWASYRHPALASGAITLGAKYQFNDARAGDAMAPPSRHTVALASTYELRSDHLGVLATAGAGERWNRTATMTWDAQAIGLLGAELQLGITSDTWVSLQFSAELTHSDIAAISLANLKWNYDITPNRSK